MAGLPLIAHHSLVPAFAEEPVEVAQFFLQSLLGGHGLAGGQAELLAPSLGFEVEGVEPFTVREHRQGRELVGAGAADAGHDRLDGPAPLGVRAMGRKAAELGPPSELAPEHPQQRDQHKRPLPKGCPAAFDVGDDQGQGNGQLRQQGQDEAEVLAGHQDADQQSPQGKAQPPDQPGLVWVELRSALHQRDDSAHQHQGRQAAAEHRRQQFQVVEPTLQAVGLQAVLVGDPPLAGLVDGAQDRQPVLAEPGPDQEPGDGAGRGALQQRSPLAAARLAQAPDQEQQQGDPEQHQARRPGQGHQPQSDSAEDGPEPATAGCKPAPLAQDPPAAGHDRRQAQVDQVVGALIQQGRGCRHKQGGPEPRAAAVQLPALAVAAQQQDPVEDGAGGHGAAEARAEQLQNGCTEHVGQRAAVAGGLGPEAVPPVPAPGGRLAQDLPDPQGAAEVIALVPGRRGLVLLNPKAVQQQAEQPEGQQQ